MVKDIAENWGLYLDGGLTSAMQQLDGDERSVRGGSNGVVTAYVCLLDSR